jgi:TorA maturation chaperone TorD
VQCLCSLLRALFECSTFEGADPMAVLPWESIYASYEVCPQAPQEIRTSGRRAIVVFAEP